MTLDDWREVIDLDLTGQFLCCREAVRRFRVQDRAARPFRAAGSIVSMSSVHERIPWAGHINYAAAKGGVRMLVQTLAQEVAAERIRVNAVAPGAIRTPINKRAWDTDEALRKLLELVPYGRIGEPEDVVAAVSCCLGRGRLRHRHNPLYRWRHDAVSGVPREWLGARRPQSRRCSTIRFRAQHRGARHRRQSRDRGVDRAGRRDRFYVLAKF